MTTAAQLARVRLTIGAPVRPIAMELAFHEKLSRNKKSPVLDMPSALAEQYLTAQAAMWDAEKALAEFREGR